MEDSNIQYNQDGISVSLKIADSDDEETRFETKANSAVTRFATCLSEGISLVGNGTDIRLVPVIPTQDAGALSLTQGRSAMNLTTSEAVRVNDNKIEYRYDSKTTIEYSLTYTGFKEDIVVSEYTGQTTYPFRLYTNGLALSKIGNSYYLVDGKGEVRQ